MIIHIDIQRQIQLYIHKWCWRSESYLRDVTPTDIKFPKRVPFFVFLDPLLQAQLVFCVAVSILGWCGTSSLRNLNPPWGFCRVCFGRWSSAQYSHSFSSRRRIISRRRSTGTRCGSSEYATSRSESAVALGNVKKHVGGGRPWTKKPQSRPEAA